MNISENTFSVSEISALIQKTLSGNFSNVTIKGEISGLKRHTSGHVYFDLKDGGAVLNCVMWRGSAAKLNFKPEDGLEVQAGGSISSYPLRSNYQLVVNSLQVSGAGALMALLEKRKKQLAEEGLFDAERKKPIPFMPQVIGVITSPTGAVIKDILHRISDRFGVHVIVYPVAVQGEGAAEQVAGAIDFFNSPTPDSQIPTPDLLIVARGGGSIEDLWAFNEEVVVRATASSKIPIISAVGHETDTTLIDYASDRRAPTPTAAAEMAVPVKRELLEMVLNYKQRQLRGINRNISVLENLIKARSAALISPKQMLANMEQRLDMSREKINSAILYLFKNKEQSLLKNTLKPNVLLNLVENRKLKIENYKKLLESYNYKNVLNRGYSIIKDSTGNLIKSANLLEIGAVVNLTLSDGERKAEIIGETKDSKAKNSKFKSLSPLQDAFL